MFSKGINFNEIPAWQKRGVDFYWAQEEKAEFNPITNEQIVIMRRVLKTDMELPMKAEYSDFVIRFVD